VTTPNDPTMSHDALDGIIASYLVAVEAGEVPNRQELLDRHPEHADALRAFFADLDRMDRVASPLRLADGADATSALEGERAGALPTVRYFGDYELLEEIARGGMGIVYKARQVSLNRLVALKMILRGTFATDKEVIRFHAEAEAAANLDHPHIVPIYEVGEHDGQQYYSMKFIEGTSLARHPHVDPRTEAAGLVAVARAVHHAHQHGVLHRDLKPSNVLVDSSGTRYVTDLGLAKRLADADASFTETGQVLGTPKYMAPEQAAGRKDLTVAAAVYSLGVVLYERLTGQTPFTGDNALTLLRQARETEPPRPTSIRPSLDRDLETIILKCLDKEPSRRYRSAEALADDLSHWLAGRPITARPVGQAERFWRWCRRNPLVSGLTAAVAASLLIGIIASTFFAVQASRRAVAESRARARAIEAEKNMEGLLARGLAKPLDPGGNNEDILSLPETETLWELAQLGNRDIGLRFLDEATRDPISLSQLRARSEPALIAAVGLDESKRDRAIGLLEQRMRDPKRSPIERADVAFIALELADRPGPLTETCAGSIIEALGSNPPDVIRRRWFVGTKSVLQVGAMEGETRGLQNIAVCVAPADSAQVISAAMARETDWNVRDILATNLVAVAARMEPGDASRMLSRTLAAEAGSLARLRLAEGLASMATRMEPSDATRAAGTLSEVVSREPDMETRQYLLEHLATVAGHLEPAQAERIYAELAQRLAVAIEKETKSEQRVALASLLAS
jgi:hypothetical protein